MSTIINSLGEEQDEKVFRMDLLEKGNANEQWAYQELQKQHAAIVRAFCDLVELKTACRTCKAIVDDWFRDNPEEEDMKDPVGYLRDVQRTLSNKQLPDFSLQAKVLSVKW